MLILALLWSDFADGMKVVGFKWAGSQWADSYDPEKQRTVSRRRMKRWSERCGRRRGNCKSLMEEEGHKPSNAVASRSWGWLLPSSQKRNRDTRPIPARSWSQAKTWMSFEADSSQNFPVRTQPAAHPMLNTTLCCYLLSGYTDTHRHQGILAFATVETSPTCFSITH